MADIKRLSGKGRGIKGEELINNLSIKTNIEAVKERIARACQRAGRSPDEVTIIAVTKTVEPSAIADALTLGLRHFGENRVQEAEEKIGQLSGSKPRPTWHMVGHLQSNKVRIAVEIFDIIHSVDSVRLAEAISRLAQKTLPVLLQVNVSGETSKSGFSMAEVKPALEAISRLPEIEIKGLMTMGPLAGDPEDSRPYFTATKKLFAQMKELDVPNVEMRYLSMGMTNSYQIALEEGANLVRIGTRIFGERDYSR